MQIDMSLWYIGATKIRRTKQGKLSSLQEMMQLVAKSAQASPRTLS